MNKIIECLIFGACGIFLSATIGSKIKAERIRSKLINIQDDLYREYDKLEEEVDKIRDQIFDSGLELDDPENKIRIENIKYYQKIQDDKQSKMDFIHELLWSDKGKFMY